MMCGEEGRGNLPAEAVSRGATSARWGRSVGKRNPGLGAQREEVRRE
jgi:hypothetical protein